MIVSSVYNQLIKHTYFLKLYMNHRASSVFSAYYHKIYWQTLQPSLIPHLPQEAVVEHMEQDVSTQVSDRNTE